MSRSAHRPDNSSDLVSSAPVYSTPLASSSRVTSLSILPDSHVGNITDVDSTSSVAGDSLSEVPCPAAITEHNWNRRPLQLEIPALTVLSQRANSPQILAVTNFGPCQTVDTELW